MSSKDNNPDKPSSGSLYSKPSTSTLQSKASSGTLQSQSFSDTSQSSSQSKAQVQPQQPPQQSIANVDTPFYKQLSTEHFPIDHNSWNNGGPPYDPRFDDALLPYQAFGQASYFRRPLPYTTLQPWVVPDTSRPPASLAAIVGEADRRSATWMTALKGKAPATETDPVAPFIDFFPRARARLAAATSAIEPSSSSSTREDPVHPGPIGSKLRPTAAEFVPPKKPKHGDVENLVRQVNPRTWARDTDCRAPRTGPLGARMEKRRAARQSDARSVSSRHHSSQAKWTIGEPHRAFDLPLSGVPAPSQIESAPERRQSREKSSQETLRYAGQSRKFLREDDGSGVQANKESRRCEKPNKFQERKKAKPVVRPRSGKSDRKGLEAQKSPELQKSNDMAEQREPEKSQERVKPVPVVRLPPRDKSKAGEEADTGAK